MINQEKIKLIRMGEKKNILIIPSLALNDPDCDVLFYVADSLEDMADQLREYAKELI